MNETRTASLEVSLFGRADYESLIKRNPSAFDDETDRVIVEHCRQFGVESPVFGRCEPDEVAVIGPECREHLLVHGLNSRQRAVIEELWRSLGERNISNADAKIYGHEAITPLALFLRGRLPKFLGSEYARNDSERERLFPIPHGDVCRSLFPDRSFHAIISCDVLEHVPSIDEALRESARILMPGGRLIATFPFFHSRDSSVRFASLTDGSIVHHVETPIYHGNPMDPDGGALVFEIPSWDILGRAREAGFSSAAIRFICSRERGITATSLGEAVRPKGVFVSVFDK